MSKRALSPVVGTVLLVAVTLVLAGTLATFALEPPSLQEPKHAVISLSADAETNRLTLAHRAGDPLVVSDLVVRVRVNDEPLAHQPPVPFFSATGFRPGPTGAFNSATSGAWHPGEATSFRVAGTNRPDISPGDSVSVRIRSEGVLVVEATATAE